MKIQINDNNYSYYKKIFEVIIGHWIKLVPAEIIKDANPIDVLNNWERRSKTLAKRSLKSGLADLVYQISAYPANLKEEINKSLAEKNLPSLQELQGIVEKTIKKVLKRGKINSLEEFYIVKEEVIDLTTGLTEADRNLLDKYLVDYETKH